MTNILRAWAAAQIVLGESGFLASVGYYVWLLVRRRGVPEEFSPVSVVGLVLLFTLVFNFGGLFWLRIDADRPKSPPRPPTPASEAR